jgi:hypothetical protein
MIQSRIYQSALYCKVEFNPLPFTVKFQVDCVILNCTELSSDGSFLFGPQEYRLEQLLTSYKRLQNLGF